MSYSYGGKQTVEQFNDTVSKWKAPPNSSHDSILLESEKYRGNINETTGLFDESVSRGSNRWAGFYSERPGASGTEYKAWVAFKNQKDASGKLINDEREYPFAPYYWAGIDCSGLVIQSIRYAEQQAKVSLSGICTSFDTNTNTCGARTGIDTNSGLFDTGVSRFFSEGNKGVVHYYFDNDDKGDNVQKIHRGDTVQYGTSHISIVYSERWVNNHINNWHYNVIHAFGYERSSPKLNKKYPWHRKVGVTGNEHPGLKTPRGFGRIKLWE